MSRDRALLHPELQTALIGLEAACAVRGLRMLITDGFRTQSEQDTLYAQGRTAPGNIVTNARYPKSAHNWGVAVDFCQNVPGHEYDNPAFFRQVGELAKDFGFTWGGDWRTPDRPHLEFRKFMPDSSTAWLETTYGTPEAFRGTWTDEEEGLAMTKEELLRVAGTGDSPSNWAREAARWARETGLISGDGQGNYGWQQPISREAVAVILYRFAEQMGLQ